MTGDYYLVVLETARGKALFRLFDNPGEAHVCADGAAVVPLPDGRSDALDRGELFGFDPTNPFDLAEALLDLDDEDRERVFREVWGDPDSEGAGDTVRPEPARGA